MFNLRLDDLREKLLRAGIAPRHVRRYLGELRQHFHDLLLMESANGLSDEAAFQAARARLGSDSDLAAAMLAQPELRSISARFPWAVFFVGPVVLLVLLLVAATIVQIGVVKITYGHAMGQPWSGGIKSFVTAWDWSMMYLLPVIVAGLVFGLGARQYISMRWLIPSALLTAILGTLVHSTTTHSSFSVGLGITGDEALSRMAASIIPVCVMGALYWLWQGRKAELTN